MILIYVSWSGISRIPSSMIHSYRIDDKSGPNKGITLCVFLHFRSYWERNGNIDSTIILFRDDPIYDFIALFLSIHDILFTVFAFEPVKAKILQISSNFIK